MEVGFAKKDVVGSATHVQALQRHLRCAYNVFESDTGRGIVGTKHTTELERSGVHLSWAAVTDVGKVREVNEDSFLAVPGLYVVADGMGGHEAGDIASQLTIDVCEAAASDFPLQMQAVAEIVTSANQAVRDHAEQHGRFGMGTTLVGIALVDNAGEDALMLFNVGDSRCYEVTNDASVTQLTTDHSVVQEMVESGDISQEEALSHPDRNIVTRAIGIEHEVFADFTLLPRASGSRFLLCSDGVSGELLGSDISTVLLESDSATSAANSLLDAVMAGDARDNATAVVLDIEWVSDKEDESAHEDIATGPRPARIGLRVIDDIPGFEVESLESSPQSQDTNVISDVPSND